MIAKQQTKILEMLKISLYFCTNLSTKIKRKSSTKPNINKNETTFMNDLLIKLHAQKVLSEITKWQDHVLVIVIKAWIILINDLCTGNLLSRTINRWSMLLKIIRLEHLWLSLTLTNKEIISKCDTYEQKS